MLEQSELIWRQNLALEDKIALSNERIIEWYKYFNGKVYVSFSGGKDSTVLLNLVRNIYPEVPAVFVHTGLEYPEITTFVQSVDNVIWLKPKKNFKAVIENYGYPIISKEVSKAIKEIRLTTSNYLRHKRLYGDENGNGKLPNKYKYLIDAPFKISDSCCDKLKKSPIHIFNTKSKAFPFIGTLASDSSQRMLFYRQFGCNAFNKKHPASTPLGFWSENDVLKYLKYTSIPYADIYGRIEENNGIYYTSGAERTGCIFCMFGINQERSPNRFQRLKLTHPKLYNYCMNTLNIKQCLDYIKVDY